METLKKMGGCVDCRFNKCELSGLEIGKSTIDHSCTQGNNKQQAEWWKNNGSRKRGELTNMKCFEYPDSTLILASMNEKVDELLKIT